MEEVASNHASRESHHAGRGKSHTGGNSCRTCTPLHKKIRPTHLERKPLSWGRKSHHCHAGGDSRRMSGHRTGREKSPSMPVERTITPEEERAIMQEDVRAITPVESHRASGGKNRPVDRAVVPMESHAVWWRREPLSQRRKSDHADGVLSCWLRKESSRRRTELLRQ